MDTLHLRAIQQRSSGTALFFAIIFHQVPDCSGGRPPGHLLCQNEAVEGLTGKEPSMSEVTIDVDMSKAVLHIAWR